MNNRKRHRVMAALPVGTGGSPATGPVVKAVDATDASDALEVAVLWLDRLAGGLDARATVELEAWLDADEIHRRVFFEMAEIYDELNALSQAPAWAGDLRAFEETCPSSKLI